MNIKNIFTKKILRSLLLGLILGSSLAQASKRAMSSNKGASGLHRRENVLAVESTGLAAATKQLFAALFPEFKSQYIEAYRAVHDITESTAHDIAVTIADEEIIRHICLREEVEWAPGFASEIQEVVQAVVKALLAKPKRWKIGVKSRRMAYDCAQEYLSSRELEVRLVFAALANCLGSHFLSVMAWYGLKDEEKEEVRTYLARAAFYEWEVALHERRIFTVTRKQSVMHLLVPTGSKSEDALIMDMLSAQPGSVHRIYSSVQKEVLAALARKSESTEQTRKRLFLETTQLSLRQILLESRRNIAFLSSLCEFLAGMHHLSTLDFTDNKLGELDAEQLRIVMNGLAGIKHLTTLNLSLNGLYKLDEQRWHVVMEGLARMQQLSSLIFGWRNGLSDEIIQQIQERLPNATIMH